MQTSHFSPPFADLADPHDLSAGPSSDALADSLTVLNVSGSPHPSSTPVKDEPPEPMDMGIPADISFQFYDTNPNSFVVSGANAHVVGYPGAEIVQVSGNVSILEDPVETVPVIAPTVAGLAPRVPPTVKQFQNEIRTRAIIHQVCC